MRIAWMIFVMGCSASPIAQPQPEAGSDASLPTDDANANEASATDVTVTDGASDAGNGCFLTNVGVFGDCITTTECTALGNHTSTPGYCPGPSDIECCTLTPSVANNPPVPTGWTLMQQSAVTPAMTTWAVSILNDPVTYPMFSTTTQMFGSQNVMARVEWHPPDFQNSAIHRGVTLYVPG
jgi:hypothetical protein